LAKFGVTPALIPDYLALVGDAADGYPGIAGYGPKTAARLINRYGRLEQFPSEILKDSLERALLFKKLATLRIDAPLFGDVEELRWRGSTASFASITEQIGSARLTKRVRDLEKGLADKSPAGLR
jgi:5'-3' exonuclease